MKLKSEGPWFCYMLRCSDDSLYVGVAKDPQHRLKEHNWGIGSKHTRLRCPVILIWQEQHTNQAAARKREAELKGWRREKKLKLIVKFEEQELEQVHPSP